jgi:hypothetical protein
MKLGLGIAVGMTALSSSAAVAADWWLVFTGGEKPKRLFVAVNETFLAPVPSAENTYKLETLTVLEDAKAPDWVSSDMIVDCSNGTLEEKLIQVSPRGGKLTTAPDQPAGPPKNVVGEQMLKFACEMGPKSEEARVAERKVDKQPQGWLHLGDITVGDIGDLAWNTMWTDGTRPASVARSKEELDREMASLGARRQKALATANAMADQVVEDEKKREKLVAETQDLLDRADARRERELPRVRKGLEAWIGHSETELVSSWGEPTSFEDHGRQHILHYYKSVVVKAPSPSQGCPEGFYPGGTQPGGQICVPIPGLYRSPAETTHECTASFEARDGTLIDYVTRGSCVPVFGM